MQPVSNIHKHSLPNTEEEKARASKKAKTEKFEAASTSPIATSVISAAAAQVAAKSKEDVLLKSKMTALPKCLSDQVVSYLFFQEMSFIATVCKLFSHVLTPSKEDQSKLSYPISLQLNKVKCINYQMLERFRRSGKNATFTDIFTRCLSLKILSVSGIEFCFMTGTTMPKSLEMYIHAQSVKEEASEKLLPHCPILEITLRGQKVITQVYIEAIVNESLGRKRLKILDKRFVFEDFESMSKTMTNLVSLEIRTTYDRSCTDSLMVLFVSNREIRELKLRGNASLTDVSILALARKAQKLETLILPNAPFSDEALMTLFSHCRELKTVEIYVDVSDDIIITLAENSPKLKKIHIDFSTQITDASIISLVQRCPKLEEVWISGSDHHVSKACIENLQKEYPKLGLYVCW